MANDACIRVLPRLAIALTAFLAALPPSAAAAPSVFDQLFMAGGSRLSQVALPAGQPTSAVAIPYEIEDILALPDGRLLGIGRTLGVPGIPTLGVVRAADEFEPLGLITPADQSFAVYEVNGLSLDHRGRLFAAISGVLHTAGGAAFFALLELDPHDAAIRDVKRLAGPVGPIAAAPGGLYGLTYPDHLVREISPETGELGKMVADLSRYPVGDLDVDSAGRIYFKYEFPCSPPCPSLGRIDPANGQIEELPDALHREVPQMRAIAIARACVETPTARCLQGGRFRATLTYEDYVRLTGDAKVAPARSRDTGVFSFFDPDNWELMVKVLDGCAINGSYWVYSSASTDVAFELTVTDTRTGAVKVYGNPLGQVARTVTDGAAFSCTQLP